MPRREHRNGNLSTLEAQPVQNGTETCLNLKRSLCNAGRKGVSSRSLLVDAGLRPAFSTDKPLQHSSHKSRHICAEFAIRFRIEVSRLFIEENSLLCRRECSSLSRKEKSDQDEEKRSLLCIEKNSLLYRERGFPSLYRAENSFHHMEKRGLQTEEGIIFSI